jgi:hypothetical protein
MKEINTKIKVHTMSDRRRFIKTFGRGIALAGMAGLGGYLLLRDQSGENCDFDFICRNCRKQKTCQLPEAKEYQLSTSAEF